MRAQRGRVRVPVGGGFPWLAPFGRWSGSRGGPAGGAVPVAEPLPHPRGMDITTLLFLVTGALALIAADSRDLVRPRRVRVRDVADPRALHEDDELTF